jgi:hypothetical protein
MPSTLSARRIIFWLVLASILAVAGEMVARTILRSKAHQAPVAAYLVPIDKTGRVKTTWWQPAQSLGLPHALRSGKRVSIPAGATVRIVHADSGEAELVAGPANLFFQQKLPVEIDTLVSPLTEVIASAKTSLPQPADSFVITSPVGKTRYLNPLISWTAREGVKYDVAVADSADPNVPPRFARGIRPPIALADLQTPQRRQLGADRNYEIIMREANAATIAGAARFLTTTDAKLENKIPSAPADLISEAADAMEKKPYRTGDAWLALTRLPPAWARSELAVRLRLRVAIELGLTDELALAQKDAAALNAW